MGPLLFVLYINDLPLITQHACTRTMFDPQTCSTEDLSSGVLQKAGI